MKNSLNNKKITLKVKNQSNSLGLLNNKNYFLPQYLIDLIKNIKEIETILKLIDKSILRSHAYLLKSLKKSYLVKVLKTELGTKMFGFDLLYNKSESFLLDICFVIFDEYPKIESFLGKWSVCDAGGTLGKFKINKSSIGQRIFLINSIKLNFVKSISLKKIKHFCKIIKNLESLNLIITFSKKSSFIINKSKINLTSFIKEGFKTIKIIQT